MNFINPYDLKYQEYDQYNGMNDNERMKTGCLQGIFYILAVVIAMIICSLLTSCKSVEYVPVIEHKTDTLIQTKVLHDSIYINDSTVITEKGDTVRIEKWHTRYVTRETHDTLYVSKTDTIPQPYPVEKEVPAELTWWQQTRLHIANILLLVIVIAALVWGIKKKLWPLPQ